MGLDSSEIYAGSLVALAGVGAGAVFVRRAWAWRAELLSLIAASLLWAGFLIIALRSSAVGEDCSEPHHEGELPMLIVTLVWTAILIVRAARPSRSRCGFWFGLSPRWARRLSPLLPSTCSLPSGPRADRGGRRVG
jgi:hypothetical protein